MATVSDLSLEMLRRAYWGVWEDVFLKNVDVIICIHKQLLGIRSQYSVLVPEELLAALKSR